MGSRNYYVVLGVASDETDQGVRAAFRDLAKRYHPDRVGPSGAVSFREVVEAYATLGDPQKRSAYDARLRPLARRDVSLARDGRDVRPSKDALLHRVARNFTGLGAPKGERVEELTVDVAISEEEAGRGARVQLGVPVFVRCSRCVGHGCAACGGQGVTEGERAVTFNVPPMTGRGTTFVMPLSELGIENLYLHVRVRVDKTIDPPAG
jgi:DnaJ-class molecular chaperone